MGKFSFQFVIEENKYFPLPDDNENRVKQNREKDKDAKFSKATQIRPSHAPYLTKLATLFV
jgi:hypothetical protein